MSAETATVAPTPFTTVRGLRPLLFTADGVLYCSRFDRIYSTRDFGRTLRAEGQLENHLRWRPLLAGVPLAQRALRTQIYGMRLLPDGTRVYVFRRGIYVQPPGEYVAHRTFPVPRGSRPVSLATGRDGLVVFGEYFRNAERADVHIYGSSDRGQSWNIVHTFAAGSIRHVHGISYDPGENCFWVCTGDYENENRLLRASADFRDVRIVRQGGQGNRFYFLLVLENVLLTATDTPLEKNYVCLIDKATGALTQLAEIENTNYYTCRVGNKIILSTNAEPSPVNDTRSAHLWLGDLLSGKWRRLVSFPVDVYSRFQRLPGIPHSLFQYPSVLFPEGDNPSPVLVCHGLGIQGYDNKLFCYDTRGWDV